MAAEVTIAQYAQFVAQSGHAAPPSPEFPQAADHPVVLLNWDDAAGFCEWAGGRLPTEAEWEYAARGGQVGLVYGSRQALSRDRANYGADQCCAGATGGGDAWVRTAPVGSFPPNDFGVYDMTGNVWEWVDGWLDDEYYASSPRINPPGAETGYARIARGGSWLNFAAALRTSVRLPFAQTGQTRQRGSPLRPQPPHRQGRLTLRARHHHAELASIADVDIPPVAVRDRRVGAAHPR